jgi:Ribbon-helix-helix protein, copG family
MSTSDTLSTRVNLQIALPVSIQIEKEAEKRGVTRSQFIKEAIHEKLNRPGTHELESSINSLKSELKELKFHILLILEKITEEKAQ